MGPQASPPNRTGPELESTDSLLTLVRRGDSQARERLVRRFLPVLTRWARGRLPLDSRDLAETDDLVQLTLIRAEAHLGHFESRHEGSFLAYLRHALLNAIRDEIRRSRRRPPRMMLDTGIADPHRSAVEEAIGNEALERYEAALLELSEEQREAVILRLEFGMTHSEIAAAMFKPSPNAARMVVARALVHVVEAMSEFRP